MAFCCNENWFQNTGALCFKSKLRITIGLKTILSLECPPQLGGMLVIWRDLVAQYGTSLIQGNNYKVEKNVQVKCLEQVESWEQ